MEGALVTRQESRTLLQQQATLDDHSVMNITGEQRGYQTSTSRDCAHCGDVASARTPSGFACIECAMQEFYEAADSGDHSWFPVVFRPL